MCYVHVNILARGLRFEEHNDVCENKSESH